MPIPDMFKLKKRRRFRPVDPRTSTYRQCLLTQALKTAAITRKILPPKCSGLLASTYIKITVSVTYRKYREMAEKLGLRTKCFITVIDEFRDTVSRSIRILTDEDGNTTNISGFSLRQFLNDFERLVSNVIGTTAHPVLLDTYRSYDSNFLGLTRGLLLEHLIDLGGTLRQLRLDLDLIQTNKIQGAAQTENMDPDKSPPPVSSPGSSFGYSSSTEKSPPIQPSGSRSQSVSPTTPMAEQNAQTIDDADLAADDDEMTSLSQKRRRLV